MDATLPPRVRFTEIGSDSFRIKIIFWYGPPDYWRYLAFVEQVNLSICRAFDEYGIQFSLPFRHSYWKHDDKQGPLDVALSTNED